MKFSNSSHMKSTEQCISYKNCVGYVRISSKGQERGFGKALQAEAITELCKNKNLTLKNIYIDSAVSGTEKGYEERESFHLMLKECHEKSINTIVVYDVSRLWRDDLVRALVKKELIKLKIQIVSYNQPNYMLESVSPSDFLVNNILEALSSFEKMQIMARLNAGRKSSLMSGKFSGGGVGLGYKAKDRDLVIDENEIKLVKKILSMKRKGKSTYAIAKNLRDTGVTGKLGGRIEPSTVRNVIKSKLYKGFLKYGGIIYKAPKYKI